MCLNKTIKSSEIVLLSQRNIFTYLTQKHIGEEVKYWKQAAQDNKISKSTQAGEMDGPHERKLAAYLLHTQNVDY